MTVSAKDSAAIYLYNNGVLKLFTPATWNAWGHKLDYANFTSQSLSSLTKSGTAPSLFTNGTTNYLALGGKKYAFTSSTQAAWGLDNADFTTLTSPSVARLSSGGGVDTLLRSKSGAVYSLIGGKRYLVPSMSDFSGLGYKWSNVMTVDDSVLSTVEQGTSFLFAPSSLIRTPNGAVSWIDTGNVRHIIPSPAVFDAYGFKWGDVRNYSQAALSSFYSSSALTPLIQTATPQYYLADKGKILSIGSSAYGASQYSFSDDTKALLSDKLVATLKPYRALTQFITGDGPTVYKVVNGQKRPISNETAFKNAGGSWSNVVTVSKYFLDSLPTGAGIN